MPIVYNVTVHLNLTALYQRYKILEKHAHMEIIAGSKE